MDTQNAFDKHRKNPGQFGYPKFQTKHDIQSCRFPVDALQCTTEKYIEPFENKQKIKRINNCINGNLLSFGSKELKDMEIHCSEKDIDFLNRNVQYIHNITVSKTKNGEYYCAILIEDVERFHYEKTGQSIGLDLGLKDMCIDSDDNRFSKLMEYNKCIEELEELERYYSKLMARKRTKIKEANARNKKNNKNNVEVDYNKSKHYIKLKEKHADICKKLSDIREDYL